MSVLLKGKNGNELELGFIRDSFADVQDGTGDSTWATLNVRAATEDESWEENAPCLNLFQFSELAEWLESVAAGEPDGSAVELSEAGLHFSLSDQREDFVTLRVAFAAPGPESLHSAPDADDPGFVDLYMSREMISFAARTLRATLAKLALDTKDDLTGMRDAGLMGEADDDLNIVDEVVDEPPGVGVDDDSDDTAYAFEPPEKEP